MMKDFNKILNVFKDWSNFNKIIGFKNIFFSNIELMEKVKNFFSNLGLFKIVSGVIGVVMIGFLKYKKSQKNQKIYIYCYENLDVKDTLTLKFINLLNKKFSIESVIINQDSTTKLKLINDSKQTPKEKIIFLNIVSEKVDPDEEKQREKQRESLNNMHIKNYIFTENSKLLKEIQNCLLYSLDFDSDSGKNEKNILEKENEGIWKELKEWFQ